MQHGSSVTASVQPSSRQSPRAAAAARLAAAERPLVVVGSQALVLLKDSQYTPPNDPPANYVDELVNAKLQKIRVLPSVVPTLT